MHGPIRRLVRDRVERRDEVRLPSAWIGGEPIRGEVAALSWFQRDAEVAAGRPEPASPVLVMLASDDSAALKDVESNGRLGERVYVIVPSGWGKGQVPSQILRCSRVLIRRVPEVPASGVHANGSARIWIGGQWRLRLELEQAEAFRQVFLRLFWHDATEETWTGGEQLTWRTADERPFDVPDLPSGAPVRLVAPDAFPRVDVQGAALHLASGAPPAATPRRLWFPPGPDHQDGLSRLVRSGTKVGWDDRMLPDLIIGENGAEALLPGTRSRLRIVLTSAQAADAARILEPPTRWRFGVDLRLGDLVPEGSVVWLPGETAARSIEPEQSIEVPDLPASTLRGVSDSSPPLLPPPQPLALSVRYRWTVVPPRLPAGAEDDPLVRQWHKVDEDWMSRLGRVRDALQAAKGERGRIRQAFSRLMSAMLGFERTHGELEAQVASMRERLPSAAGPAGAPEMLSRLAEIEEQSRKLRGDMEEAERKAREDQEREKQEAAWQSRVSAAIRDVPSLRGALSEAEARRPGITEELATIEKSLKSADKGARADLIARQRKVSDELDWANKEVSRLRGELAASEQRAAERFEFRPAGRPPTRVSQSGGRFVPASASTRSSADVPKEELPAVGALRRHRGQRYLVIQNWEDLTAGEQAANRLSAALVAPEDA